MYIKNVCIQHICVYTLRIACLSRFQFLNLWQRNVNLSQLLACNFYFYVCVYNCVCVYRFLFFMSPRSFLSVDRQFGFYIIVFCLNICIVAVQRLKARNNFPLQSGLVQIYCLFTWNLFQFGRNAFYRTVANSLLATSLCAYVYVNIYVYACVFFIASWFSIFNWSTIYGSNSCCCMLDQAGSSGIFNLFLKINNSYSSHLKIIYLYSFNENSILKTVL